MCYYIKADCHTLYKHFLTSIFWFMRFYFVSMIFVGIVGSAVPLISDMHTECEWSLTRLYMDMPYFLSHSAVLVIVSSLVGCLVL